jgi:hypothetical protein
MTWKLKKRKRKGSLKKEKETDSISNPFQLIFSNGNLNKPTQYNNFFAKSTNHTFSTSKPLSIKNR